MSETPAPKDAADARSLEDQFMSEIDDEIKAVIAEHEGRHCNPVTPGRSSKLCYASLCGILRTMARGTPKSRAPLAMGISARSWNNWLEAYPAINDLADKAKGYCVAQLAEEIRQGVDIKGNPDWKARAWLLERTDKEHFTAAKPDTTITVNNNTLSIVGNPVALEGVQSLHEQAMRQIAEQREQRKALMVQTFPVSPAQLAQPVAVEIQAEVQPEKPV